MKWLTAGLTFVNFTVISGLVFGIIGRGLNPRVAPVALSIGAFAAVLSYFDIFDPGRRRSRSSNPEENQAQPGDTIDPAGSAWHRYRHVWKWLVAACFAMFALRSFLWLIYIDGDQLRIQSPNNLGDLSLHIAFIKNFANGVSLWPQSPILTGTGLRYPAGTDLFNAVLLLFHIDLIHGLVWAGLLGSLATFYAFYRWGKTFAVAGFLFNGGVAGFEFFLAWQFRDYQAASGIAWKSIPLSMFVTQRGLLYAIPVGLVLLWHWREMYRGKVISEASEQGEGAGTQIITPWVRGPLPFWVELSLYASMPLFHVHTFVALSVVLVFLFLSGDDGIRWRTALLAATAFVPASLCVWLVSDHFHAASMLAWHPGWVESDGEFSAPFLAFWLNNFGVWVPLILVLLGWCGWRAWREESRFKIEPFAAIALAVIGLCVWRLWAGGFAWSSLVFLLLGLAFFAWCVLRIAATGFTWSEKPQEEVAFLLAAVVIFVAGLLFKFAPWGWDNLKVMMWSYFIILPFLWDQLISRWSMPVRVALCIMLFGSGFVSLFGGLAAGRPGFGLVDRAELDGVGHAVRHLPAEARFAAYPTYNHPLLLQGRDVVLGYPGHLWTEGLEYGETFQKLNRLMQGAANWRQIAHQLHARYIFWGPDEIMNYQGSARPWEKAGALVTSGSWGAIYDAGTAAPSDAP
jgi:hypothetical protein